jgi:conjugative transfer signal peptidase TraF
MKTSKELSRFYLAAFAITAILSALASLIGRHLIYNGTESMPLGLYWISAAPDLHRGDTVAFPVPPKVRQLVWERRYLPDGAVLLKPVVAVAGDHVCARGSTFAVNGHVVGAVLRADSQGRLLPRYEGCGEVRDGEVFVASTHPQSFDSRSFGPVPIAAVSGTVRLLWTF